MHTKRTHTTPVPLATSAPTPLVDTDGEQYQSAKGCLMLALMILGAAVLCAAMGIGIHLFLEARYG